MSNQDFATELFVDVTEEQQQMVAGGDGYKYGGYDAGQIFKDFIKTKYENKEFAFALDADVFAGKGGAAVTQTFAAKKAAEKAEALKDVIFKF